MCSDDSFGLYPSISPEVAATDWIEKDVPKAFVDGIIAVYEGLDINSWDGSHGRAFHRGFDFGKRFDITGIKEGRALDAFRHDPDISNSDSDYVEGFIAMAEERFIHPEDTQYSEPFHRAYQFAHRWGERGKDLGLDLKYYRDHAGEGCTFRVDPY